MECLEKSCGRKGFHRAKTSEIKAAAEYWIRICYDKKGESNIGIEGIYKHSEFWAHEMIWGCKSLEWQSQTAGAQTAWTKPREFPPGQDPEMLRCAISLFYYESHRRSYARRIYVKHSHEIIRWLPRQSSHSTAAIHKILKILITTITKPSSWWLLAMQKSRLCQSCPKDFCRVFCTTAQLSSQSRSCQSFKESTYPAWQTPILNIVPLSNFQYMHETLPTISKWDANFPRRNDDCLFHQKLQVRDRQVFAKQERKHCLRCTYRI